jgi:hypothetical protein
MALLYAICEMKAHDGMDSKKVWIPDRFRRTHSLTEINTFLPQDSARCPVSSQCIEVDGCARITVTSAAGLQAWLRFDLEY